MDVDDPAVQWRQASFSSILIDKAANRWETGHLNDVAVTWRGTLLVGAETGGVWAVDPEGTSAIPLSDGWDNPDVRCIRFGPDGDDHVFAGGGVLHVTDQSAPVPLFSWYEIPSFTNLNAGTVHSIAIMAGPRRIVVACDQGIFWSEIPPAGPPPKGCLASLFGGGSPPAWKDMFSWRPAKDGDGTYRGTMFSIALGTRNREHHGPIEGLSGTTVVAGALSSGGSRGLFVGEWDKSGDLVMRRAHLSGALDLVQLEMASVAVDVCRTQPSRLYGSASDDNGRLMIVVRSDDGGATWDACGTKLMGGATGDIVKNAGEQGNDGWNNCVGASPFDSDLVAFGWQFGPFVSDDGGATWYQAEGPNHADHHCVAWDPRLAVKIAGGTTSERIYVCSDGGIVSSDDRGKTFDSRYNQHILVLQCYAAAGGRESWGSVGCGPAMPGVVAAGVQDNGNLYATIDPYGGPFTHLDGGDGGFNIFLDTGWALHDIGLQPAPQPIQASRWDPGPRRFVDTRVPPINKPKPGNKKEPKGLTAPLSLEAVLYPTTKRGTTLRAVCGVPGGDIYGLYTPDDTANMEWRYLGTVNGDPWSVASVDGTSIFVGTSGRRIYNLDPANGYSVEYLYDEALHDTGTILRIVPFANDRAYAIQDWDTTGDIIALRGLVWERARTGIPTTEGAFWGLDQARNIDNATLVAVTDAHVWISYDEARTWNRASQGLPARPHGADIRFARYHDGHQRLHLGTYGRSLWVADLLPDVDGQVHVPGQPPIG